MHVSDANIGDVLAPALAWLLASGLNLADAECDAGQGWFFGRPLNAVTCSAGRFA